MPDLPRPSRRGPLAIFTTTESSWHRRARRQRQLARGVLAVDKARRVLLAHHGGGGMQPQYGSLPPWDCKVCGTENNWGFKRRCRACTAYPPQEHRHLQQEQYTKGGFSGGKGHGKSNGKGKGKGKGPATNKSPNPELGAYAYRQIQRANAAQSTAKSNKDLQEAKRRAESLSEANTKLQRELAEAKAATSHGQDEEMEWEGPEELDEEGRRARMDKIRGSLPYLEEHFGADSELYLDAQHELEQHQRAIRESKPYKTHRTILERRVEKLRRLQERDHDRLAELSASADDIEAKIESTSNAMAERGKELETAEAELRELLLKAVGEENTAPAAPPDPQQSWDAVVGTVAGLVRQPGVPAQFTCQLEGLFGQLRAMVEQLQSHAAANAVAQPTSYAQAAKAAASASSLSSSTSPPAASAASAPTAAAAGAAAPTTDTADELRRRQRRARQQQRQSEAIAEFERDYRAKLRAVATDGVGGTEGHAVPLPATPQCPNSGPALPPTPTPPPPAAPPSEATHPVATASANGQGGCAEQGGSSSAHNQAPAEGSAQGGASVSNVSVPAAACAAASAAAVAVADGEPALESCFSELDNGSDVTGTLSGEELQDGMDIDKMVSTIPKEQREGVRSMLEKSKCRRMRQIQRRLKKPTADEPALPRNPKK